MPKNLSHEVYQDKVISCRKCQKVIGHQKLDGQVLILESGLIAFNYLCWRCPSPCNLAASWLAPILPGEAPTNANQSPDVGDIIHKALSVKEKAKKLGYREKQKRYQPNQTNQPKTADF
jgi:hypothetical protein